MAGRPRQTKVTAIKFLARRDSSSEVFDSRREANLYASSARRSSSVEPIYHKCRYWALEIERFPLPGEELLEYEDLSGHLLREKELTIKGDDPEILRATGDRLRRASFERAWTICNLRENLGQLSPDSRRLAIDCKESYYEREDVRMDQAEATKELKRAEAERQAAIDAIPTVAQLFLGEVDRKIEHGQIQRNTGEIYKYEASAFDLATTVGDDRKPLGEIQIHRVTRAAIREWFGVFAARETRFGRLPTMKTCVVALNHLRTVGKALKSDDILAMHAAPFDVLDTMLDEIKKSKGKGDGWRNRHRLTNEAVECLVAICETDLERAALALALAGARPPSETVAVRWTNLEQDKSGHLWWHVSASIIELANGKLDVRDYTKTQDADYRQLSIAQRFVPWIEKLRDRSPYVLGNEDEPMLPSAYTEMMEGLLARAGLTGTGISTYSLRHTVSDEVERLLGRSARDLVLHGQRDRTTGSRFYSHAERDRRRKELTFNGRPYGEHMVWARPSEKDPR